MTTFTILNPSENFLKTLYVETYDLFLLLSFYLGYFKFIYYFSSPMAQVTLNFTTVQNMYKNNLNKTEQYINFSKIFKILSYESSLIYLFFYKQK